LHIFFLTSKYKNESKTKKVPSFAKIQQIGNRGMANFFLNVILNPSPAFASGGQEPFREKVPGLPKAFH